MIIIDKQLRELGNVEFDIDCEIGTSEAATNDFEFARNIQVACFK